MKQFKITYAVCGGKRNDYVVVFAKDIVDAINVFEKTEIVGMYTKIIYNKHSIVSIEVY